MHKKLLKGISVSYIISSAKYIYIYCWTAGSGLIYYRQTCTHLLFYPGLIHPSKRNHIMSKRMNSLLTFQIKIYPSSSPIIYFSSHYCNILLCTNNVTLH
uniref:Uncharacterized protein n=1 Tax=Triticum urartu TaxID=4572 RepID=A0A8R7TV30_TRIUA